MRTILSLLTGFFVTFSFQKLNACGFSVDSEEYRYHLLFPEALGKGPIMPFHFTSAYWYSSPFDYVELGIEKNCEEWSKTDGKRHRPEDWEKALYEISYAEILANEDTFLHAFLPTLQTEVKEAYLMIKKIEGLFADYSPWVADNKVTGPNKASLFNEAEALYHKTKSKELRCRIAFQLMRLSWGAKVKEVFENYLKPVQSHSITGKWALRHLSGYYNGVGDDAMANVLLARLFVQTDEWKYWAREYYTKGILVETLKKAENQEDKEAILILDALTIPTKGLDKLKRLYRMNPDNPLIDMLLMREINKMEDLLYTPAFTGGNAPAIYGWWANYDTRLPGDLENKIYAKQLRQFVWQETKGKKRKSAFWNLSAAYLAMLDDELGLANKFLSRSKACADFTPGIEIQWLTLTALYQAKDQTQAPFLRRQKVAATYLSLKEKLSWNKKASSILSNLALILGNTFHQSGDQVMAAYCFAHCQHYHANRFTFFYNSDWYRNDEVDGYDEEGYFTKDWAGNIQFFFYLEKEATTATISEIYRQLNFNDLSESLFAFSEPVKANRYRVYDLLGTRHFIEKDYVAALQVYDKIPDIWWDTCKWDVYKELPRHPFNSPIEFIASPINLIKSHSNVNKCIIADSMCRWHKMQAISKGEPASVYQFKMANLLLNTGYMGNAWAMTRYWRSSNDESGEYGYSYQKGIEKKRDQDYFDHASARFWYRKAYQNSKDPLMRASCLARLAYCEDETPFYTASLKYGAKKIRLHQLPPGLQKLLKEYPDMAASMYAGCPGFDAFFAKR